jgi:hypothetical protein
MSDARERIFQALMKAMDAHKEAVERRDTPANVAFAMGRCSGLSAALMLLEQPDPERRPST